MPDDLGDAEEKFMERLNKMRAHKIEMILKNIKCKCVFCRPNNGENKIPPVSLF
ncbi:MAG: hypothetical protein ACXAC5_05040 [Promethearchaeota archaeon]|jgi:predicted molibdopterin-dependent oxidoreductase YjgC